MTRDRDRGSLAEGPGSEIAGAADSRGMGMKLKTEIVLIEHVRTFPGNPGQAPTRAPVKRPFEHIASVLRNLAPEPDFEPISGTKCKLPCNFGQLEIASDSRGR